MNTSRVSIRSACSATVPAKVFSMWDDCRADRSALQTIKHFRRARARNYAALRQHPLRRFVAERPEFPLNGYFHFVLPDKEGSWKATMRAHIASPPLPGAIRRRY